MSTHPNGESDGRLPPPLMASDGYNKQLHIWEAKWKPPGCCGTPGCILPDFHEGLCSTEQALGRRKRPAPGAMAPARASGSERGGGRKKHDRIRSDDDANDDEEEGARTPEYGGASGPEPSAPKAAESKLLEGFLEGEEQRLCAQLAAVRARKMALAAAAADAPAGTN